MKPAHTPERYSTVSPYLVVNGASATIAFLKRAFGAMEQARHSDEPGLVRHSEVRIGECIVMVSDPVPPDWPAMVAHVHVFVSDADAAYRRALEAGATSVHAPVQKDDDEDKRGGVKDAGGTTWWISSRVAQ